MKNSVSTGKTIDITAGGDIASGGLVTIGELVGVSANKLVSGEKGPLFLEGVYEVAKLQGDVVTQGLKLYHDVGNARLTLTSSTHKFAGHAQEDADGTVSLVKVRLERGA